MTKGTRHWCREIFLRQPSPRTIGKFLYRLSGRLHFNDYDHPESHDVIPPEPLKIDEDLSALLSPVMIHGLEKLHLSVSQHKVKRVAERLGLLWHPD